MTAATIEPLTATTLRPRLVPLAWEDGKLVPTLELSPASETEAKEEITILHTNDFHSSISGRTDPVSGQVVGGIARIATTIQASRKAGPTLVLDGGDSVFGSGTWWDARGATTTARLRGAAGYDLAALGNHDLEHGLEGLSELFEGGYLFVAANLFFEEARFAEKVRPAYIAEIGGWRVGLTGVTTPDTLHLVPARMLQGVTLTDPLEALTNTLAALEPLVDTVIIISHLGFSGHGMGDRELAPRLAGSKVSVILGGHTHEAHDPAPVISGIIVCNAGANGANINEVKISQGAHKALEVRTRLIPQNETVAEEPEVTSLRETLAEAFQPLFNTKLSLPELPELGEDGLYVSFKEFSFRRDREAVLLARALHASGRADQAGAVFVPILYVLGQLPRQAQEITLAELVVSYPNIEKLVELEVEGYSLKELLALQDSLLFYQQALPLWLNREERVKAAHLDDNARYRIITSELVAEGGLGWTPLPAAIKSYRQLEASCAEIVREYLASARLSTVA
jgi:5'-nucleotidase